MIRIKPKATLGSKGFIYLTLPGYSVSLREVGQDLKWEARGVLFTGSLPWLSYMSPGPPV